MSGAHSLIAPSGANIWGKEGGCTAYPLMVQTFPEEETPESREGEAGHELAARLVLETATRGSISPVLRSTLVGTPAANGELFTDEMFDGAELYANRLGEETKKRGIFGGVNIGIEKPVKAPQIHPLSEGTPDFKLWDPRALELIVADYKSGYEAVEVFENYQLINYAAGLIHELQLSGLDDQYITVIFLIIQPRAMHRKGPIREWRVKLSDLRGDINILHAKAHQALGPNAECHSGDHCKHCPGRHACEAAIHAGMSLYEVTSRPLPMNISIEALGLQLAIVDRAVKQLEYLRTGLSTQVEQHIRSGKLVPFWGTEPTFGRMKWSRPVAEVAALGKAMSTPEKSFNLLKPPEAITPKQAIALGLDESVVRAFSETPRTGLKLVPDNGNKAKQVFNNG